MLRWRVIQNYVATLTRLAILDLPHQRGQHLSRRPREDDIRYGGKIGLVGVGLDKAGSPLLGDHWQAGRRPDGAGGAYHQHAIALLRLLYADRHNVLGYGLAEHHAVDLDNPAALGTGRRYMSYGKFTPRQPYAAVQAAQLGAVAVNLGHVTLPAR